MLNKISKLILFYFAYLPLFAILVINNVTDLKNSLILAGLLVIIGWLSVWVLLKTINSVVSVNEKISILDSKNNEYLSFLVTYIVPFFIDFTGINHLISFSIFFLMILYFYMETSLFCINPLLKLIFGYNIYEVSINKQRHFLLSKNQHTNQTLHIKLKKLDTNILIEE